MNLTITRVFALAAVLLLVVAASTIGTYMGQQFADKESGRQQPIVLNAETAASGKSISMATGLVDRQRLVEGMFILDHLSGRLQCWLVNPRTGEIGGI